jgi:hypothetical protein
MVSNSTNINKTNNHLSPKESINSDGHQYHQYQQSEQPPLIQVLWKESSNITYIFKNKKGEWGTNEVLSRNEKQE